MFIPLRDDNPLKSIRFQYVTLTLIAVNVARLHVRGDSGLDDGASSRVSRQCPAS